VWVLIVVLFIGGLIAYNGLPREAAPDIAIPIVIVSTPYFGVSPADMETLVTNPIEKEFKGLSGLKKMTSTSAESVSLVTLEFEPSINIEDALQRIRDRLDKAKPNLPADAEDPEVIEINASDWPIMIVNVSGDMDPLRLKELAEDIQDDIEKVKGVLRVDLAGGVEREIQVLVDPERLTHYQVSLDDILNKIRAENINLPGGAIDVGPMKYTVRVPGEFESVQLIEDLVVKSPGGNPIYLRDVAKVVDTFKEPKTMSRLTTFGERNGEVTSLSQGNVSLSVVKRAGENIITIADEVKELLKTYEARVPEGVNIKVLNDQSLVIQAQVHDLENNIISGMILVLATLFFFMGGWRNALFVAISVPLSMLISFMILSALGYTLNMVVLFSLVLALGMLVDNAIVVVENIYRHASEGKDRVTAALDGTKEVSWAIISSTATTVGAFFPMIFWPGVMGEFMGFLPRTVIITLMASLFVALVINPTVCATFLKVPEGVQTDEFQLPDNALYRAYKKTLEFALGHRILVIVGSMAALVGSIMLFGSAQLGVEFFPKTTPERFEINIELPDGSRLATTDQTARIAESPIDTEANLVEAWIVDVGVKGGGGGMAAGGSADHYARISVDLVDVADQPIDPNVFMDRLRELYAGIPGASIVLKMESMGPPAGAPINIEIVGEDLAVMGEIARDMREVLRTIPGVIDLQDDLELSRPEVHVVVDRARAAVAGVDTRTVAQTVRTAINGTEASVYREGDEEYDITVRLPEDKRRSIEDLSSLNVVNKDHFHIPLTEVAKLEVTGGAGSIRRKNQDRVVTVSANAASGYLPAKLLEEAQDKLKDIKVPPGYEIRYTGENEDQQEAASFLGKALLAALFIIILILVTQFNSLLQPLIIMGSVIMSLIGVFLALFFAQMPFGVIMSGIGIISLAGVAVNNGIVLIDFANQLRARGMSVREAASVAGAVRMRPVVLTATTTVLGLAPLVFGVSFDFVNTQIVVGGRSVEMWGPMAVVVAFGLIVSTGLTLIVVPVMYDLFESTSEKVRKALFKTTATVAMLMIVGLAPIALNAQEAPAQPAAQPESERLFRTPEDVGAANIFESSRDLAEFKIESSRHLSLADARALLRVESLDLKALKTQSLVADALVKQAWSTVIPTFSAGANYSVNQEEINASFGPPMPGVEPIVIQPKTTWNWNVSASLRMNFRALSLLKQAYLQQELADLSVKSMIRQLDLGLVQSYYALLTTRRVMEIGQEQLLSAETLLKATNARRDAGTATEFEVTRAELQVVQAQKAVERARLNFVNIRVGLADLLQTKPDFDVLEAADTLAPDLEEVRAKSEKRSDLEESAKNVEFNELRLREMYLNYLPTLSATFTFAQQKATAFGDSDPRWTLTFGANWTIWDGGFREGEVDKVEAALIAAQAQEKKLQSSVGAAIDQAWADYLSSVTQMESGKTQVALAETASKQASIAYQYGAATQLDVINAEDQVAVARLALLQDKLAVELAIMRLQNLAGEL
jgi:CzcA family heavy metal efflux pump